jgi:Trehalase-like, N-terminal
MRPEIGDYALLGDTRTAALVSRGGSIDWLCLPRFDSPACFAAILGSSEHGRWLLAPAAEPVAVRRGYRGDTLIMETEYEGREGAVTVVDAMPIADGRGGSIVRVVVGRGGRVPMRMELAPRFGYGRYSPVLARAGGDLLAVCGPDTLRLSGPFDVESRGGTARAAFTAGNGSRSCSPGSPPASLLPRAPSPRLWSAVVSAGGGPGPCGAPTTANGARPSSGRC